MGTNKVKFIKDVTYCCYGDREMRCNIFLPAKSKDELLPAVIYIHGGSWKSGSKDTENSIHMGEKIAANRFVCMSIDYRLSSEKIFPAAVVDVVNAIEFIKTNAKQYGVNREKIAIWGCSSGAHIGMLAAFDDGKEFKPYILSENINTDVQVVCSWFGPTDLSQLRDYDIGDINNNSPVTQFLGHSLASNKDNVKRANPIEYISSSTPPIFIAHGTDDKVIPCEQSIILKKNLDEAGIKSQVKFIEKAGHGDEIFLQEGQTFIDTIDFLKRVLD